MIEAEEKLFGTCLATFKFFVTDPPGRKVFELPKSNGSLHLKAASGYTFAV